MILEFDIPHAFFPGAAKAVNSNVLAALLECMVRINAAYLRATPCPALYRAGVVYGRTKVWNTIPATLALGYGDCKSLAPWLVAEYRLAGRTADPVFRWIDNARGGTDFHILVQTDRGFEDPSRVLGMNTSQPNR